MIESFTKGAFTTSNLERSPDYIPPTTIDEVREPIPPMVEETPVEETPSEVNNQDQGE